MKYLFIFYLFISNFMISQDKKEIPPAFQICNLVPENLKSKCFEESIQEHINENLIYPNLANEMALQSIVSVFFEIDTLGNVKNIKAKSNLVGVEFSDVNALSNANKLFEDAASEIISKLPKMVPGTVNGSKTSFPFQVSITYRLKSQFDPEKIYDIDTVFFPPLIKGCETAKESKKCFKEKIQIYFENNLKKNRKKSETNDEIIVFIELVIGSNNDIVDYSIIGPELFRKQLEKLIKRIPIDQPALVSNRPVNFSYSFSVKIK